MKKILGLTIAAMLIIGMVAGATWAVFSDTAKSDGNTFTAGTLTLGLVTTGDATKATASTSPAGITNSMQFTNVKPGSSGTITWTLNNTGTVPGTLTMPALIVGVPSTFTTFNDTATNAPKVAALAALAISDPLAWGTPWDLSKELMVWVTRNSLDVTDWGTTTAYIPMSNLAALLAADSQAMVTGTPLVYVLHWQIPTTVGNEIQGDIATLNITFTLTQTP
jgi:predicted ribosomally synthesized peptide with SipW-like signal peptide